MTKEIMFDADGFEKDRPTTPVEQTWLPVPVDERAVPVTAPLPDRYSYSTSLALDLQQSIMRKLKLGPNSPIYRAELQAATALVNSQLTGQIRCDEAAMRGRVMDHALYLQAITDRLAERQAIEAAKTPEQIEAEKEAERQKYLPAWFKEYMGESEKKETEQ